MNSISVFIPHHVNKVNNLFTKRDRDREKLSIEACNRLLNTNWYELESPNTSFPIPDRRDRVNKSRRFWIVTRILKKNKLSTFGIHGYIDRKITKIDGRSCVRWNNKYHPVHTKVQFNQYRKKGYQGELYFFSNLHPSVNHEDIMSIDSLKFIFDDEIILSFCKTGVYFYKKNENIRSSDEKLLCLESCNLDDLIELYSLAEIKKKKIKERILEEL